MRKANFYRNRKPGRLVRITVGLDEEIRTRLEKEADEDCCPRSLSNLAGLLIEAGLAEIERRRSQGEYAEAILLLRDARGELEPTVEQCQFFKRWGRPRPRLVVN